MSVLCCVRTTASKAQTTGAARSETRAKHVNMHVQTHGYPSMHPRIHPSIRPSTHPPIIHPSIHPCQHGDMLKYKTTCLHVHMHACLHAGIQTYMHTYVHTYIHTYLPTHGQKHVYMNICFPLLHFLSMHAPSPILHGTVSDPQADRTCKGSGDCRLLGEPSMAGDHDLTIGNKQAIESSSCREDRHTACIAVVMVRSCLPKISGSFDRF